MTVFHNPKPEEGGQVGSEKRVVEKIVEKLSPNQRKIVDAIVKNPAISAQALAELIGISHRKTQDNLSVENREGPLFVQG